MKFKFNDIANAISVISGVSLAGIIGVGSYVYLNKDAIIEDIKEAAIESVVGGMGGGALGGSDSLPIGTPDLAPPSDQASVKPSSPVGQSMGLPVPSSAF
tara:strand:+ start:326 stop:625 length:300 start_codon:yes stop_codon:yes gene_type:complete